MDSNELGQNKRIALVGMPCWAVNQPFHALAIVAAVARDAGFDVELHDLNIDYYHVVDEEDRKYWAEDFTHLWNGDELPRRLWDKHSEWLHGRLADILDGGDFSLICFSVNFCTRYFSIQGAKYLKSKRPDIPIMFGGVDCFPGELNKELLSHTENWHCDIICQGECEISLKKYLENLAETGNWKTTLPGFAYYDDGALVDTGDAELPDLKDKQPFPAFDLFDLSRYTGKGSLPFYFSRGCIYRCHFCSEKPNFKKYRCRDAEEAFEELRQIVPLVEEFTSTPTLSFSDSILNANVKELEKFVDLIIENGMKIKWGGQAHIHHLMTYDLLQKMSRAGFVSVFWGLESASQHVVDLMNKKFSWKDADRILNDCSKLGIKQAIPILMGFPGETPEDIVDTLNLIFKFKDDPLYFFHQPNLIVVRPKSPLYERYAEFGLANNNYYDWSTTDLTNTLAIRLARRFVARQAHSNPDLSLENIVDTEEIRQIDLDERGVANDLFRLIHEIFLRAGEPETLYSMIDQWRGKVPVYRKCYMWLFRKWARNEVASNSEEEKLEPSANESDEIAKRKVEYLNYWHQIRKDDGADREELYGLICFALKRLQSKAKQDTPENRIHPDEPVHCDA